MKKVIWLVLILVVGAGAWWVTANARQFLESAAYTTVRQEGDFEIRDYPSLTVAVTAMKPDGEDSAFRQLFNYISGGNVAEQKVAMTVPVFMDEPRGETEPGTMSFVVPREVAQAGAPGPKNDQVRIETRPAQRVAVYRFKGRPGEKKERKAIETLRAWCQEQSLEIRGEPIIAYYDAPWIPGPFRRNEAMLQVAETDSASPPEE